MNQQSKYYTNALFFFLMCLSLSGCHSEKRQKHLQAVQSDAAMVVTAHPLATQVGLDVLKRGGNAFDATIATQFALAVVYPRAGNIGGGGLLTLRTSDGTTEALDYREKAPLSATRDMFLDETGNVHANRSTRGHLAVGVPGTVAGMEALHKKYGSMPWDSLLYPAVNFAKNGFLITVTEANRLNYYQADFDTMNTESAFQKKQPWTAGDLLYQPGLARTLKRIADRGKSDFYEGATAQMLVREMEENSGLISAEDLKSYEAIWRKPLIDDYGNYTIISMPPPSSGGVALLQILEMWEQNKQQLQLDSVWTVAAMHLLIEAERRAYADRALFLGDQDFFDVPMDKLLDSNYLHQRMTDYSPALASVSDSVSQFDVQVQIESFETTHTSIIDADGNAVSTTTTLNGNYGSKVVVRNAGFFLNNEMDDFSAKPGVPNQFGLIGAEANAIEPQKRMLSSMTPTIVEKDGELHLVLGTPGGSTIITSVAQVILQVTDLNRRLDEAVAAPRFHHQWLPDEVWYEAGKFDETIISSLREMGHKPVSKEVLGKVKAIQVLPSGKLLGVGDPRHPDDCPDGY